MKTLATLLLLSVAAIAQVPPPPQAFSGGPAPVLREPLRTGFTGSIAASGGPTAAPLDLSLRDALQRGLQYNLGTLTSREIAESTRAERQRVLSALLPSLSMGNADFTANRPRRIRFQSARIPHYCRAIRLPECTRLLPANHL